MLKIKIIICFSCFLIVTRLPGQSLNFENYSVKQGLPSSEVYQVFQDSKGYIWMATDMGVCRYDGYEFKSYSVDEGLTKNTILQILEDARGRIWFRTIDGSFFYLENNIIHSIRANDKLVSLISNGLIYSSFLDSKDTLWVGFFLGKGIIKIAPDYKPENVIYDSTYGNNCYLKVIENNGLVWGSSSKAFKKEFNVFDNSKIYPKVAFNKNEIQNPIIRFSKLKDGSFLSCGENQVIKFNAKEIIKTYSFESNIISCYEDSEQNIWVGTLKNGTFFLPKGDKNNKPVKVFPSLTATCFLEDHEGSIWISTLEQGVFLIRSKYISIYNFSNSAANNKVNCISSFKGKTVAGLFNGTLVVFDKDTVKKIDLNLKNSETTLSSMLATKDHLLIGSSIGCFELNDDFKQPALIKHHNAFWSVRNLCLGNDSSVWTCNWFGLIKLKKYNKSYNTVSYRIPSNPYAIHIDHNSKIWLGNSQGLSAFENGMTIKYGTFNNVLRTRVVDIKQDQNKNMWIATRGNGIVLIHGQSVYQIRKKQGLISNLCRAVFIDDENKIWVATNKGLSCIIPDKTKPWKYVIENFNELDGLPSVEINGVCKNGNYIWLATNDGVTRFEPGKVKHRGIELPIFISNVKISEMDTTVSNKYSLSYDQNNIEINFIAFSFKKPGSIIYKYKMDGIDTQWHYTTSRSVKYPTLPYGNYNFKIAALNSAGISGIPVTIKFNIEIPVWKRWWFISFVLALISAAIFSGIRWRVKVINMELREKATLNQKVSDLQLRALSAQMNPHFIFNAMNSIQYFMLQNDGNSAQKYLSKFSRLIRSVLDNSQQKSILLDQEIKTLTLYLELESLRFENKFEYKIEVDDSVDQFNIEIPSMLIQPFVENSIWHGLMHKTNAGFIIIKFSLIEDVLKCSIEDNGIGRKKAGEIREGRDEKHFSKGVSITRERLKLLNEKAMKNFNVHFTDLSDESDNSLGTRVEIFINV